MNWLIGALVNLSLTSVALAGQFIVTPSGQLLFTPQASGDPGTHYYQSPQGGPPIGYAIPLDDGHKQIYHPFDGSSSYVVEGEEQQ